MYMWVYVISIMETWKDSTKGHNNLTKLNGSQASICRRFEHWYWHMALVGNMTIEELALFYFQKEIIRNFTIHWDREDPHCHTISTSQQPRFGRKHLLPIKFYFSLLSQSIPTNSKRHRAQRYALGSCKVLA
jgi:hypothetical protein